MPRGNVQSAKNSFSVAHKKNKKSVICGDLGVMNHFKCTSQREKPKTTTTKSTGFFYGNCKKTNCEADTRDIFSLTKKHCFGPFADMLETGYIKIDRCYRHDR